MIVENESAIDRCADRAASIIRHATRKGRPLAVFYVGHGFKTAPMDNLIDVHARNFVGVYDEKCQPEWLESDLVWFMACQKREPRIAINDGITT